MATRFIRRRRRDSESGAELIEFSLVFMILMMVVLGVVDFALVFQRNEVLTNATREGARVGVLPGYTPTDVQNRVMSFVA
jgi:Flp pilus assembly protein TadG